jgi:hypothetical protein
MCYFCNATQRHNTVPELLEVGQPCSARHIKKVIWDNMASGAAVLPPFCGTYSQNPENQILHTVMFYSGSRLYGR